MNQTHEKLSKTVNTSSINEALQRSSSALASAGNSLEQLVSIVVAI